MKSLQGYLLIASPRLADPNFAQAVVLIVQHGESGALGLILNRPLDVTLQTVWQEVSEVPCLVDEPLHQGGPCEGPLMVLHGEKELAQATVLPGLYWSTEKDAVEQLVTQNSSPSKYFVGYAGWSAGQLEGELETGAWLTMPAGSDAVFQDGDDVWDRLRRRVALTAAYPWLDSRLIPDDPQHN